MTKEQAIALYEAVFHVRPDPEIDDLDELHEVLQEVVNADSDRSAYRVLLRNNYDGSLEDAAYLRKLWGILEESIESGFGPDCQKLGMVQA